MGSNAGGGDDWIYADGDEAVYELLGSDFDVGQVLLQPHHLTSAVPLVRCRIDQAIELTKATAQHSDGRAWIAGSGSGPTTLLICTADVLEKATGVDKAAKHRLAFASARRPPTPSSLEALLPA